MAENITRHVFISGRVQGVGYRAWTSAEARRRGLQGWVRNRRDGRVEAVFHGPAEVVNAMLEACGRGPMLARVTGIHPGNEEAVTPPQGAFQTRETV